MCSPRSDRVAYLSLKGYIVGQHFQLLGFVDLLKYVTYVEIASCITKFQESDHI